MLSNPHSTTPWLRISQPNPGAHLRLFCFPYAGGAASIYRTWYQHLPPTIEVCAVQLPGRENRIKEAPFTDAETLVQALIPQLLPYLDRPFALFGHSMGTILAYELARQLVDRQLVPTQLFVSGRRAPYLPPRERNLHTLSSDDHFLAALQERYNNIPALILEEPELRALFLPLLRADMTLVESYLWRDQSPLPCPMTAFGGDADPWTTETDLQAWQCLTHGAFDLHLFSGGHFYLNEAHEALLARVAATLNYTALQ